MSSGIGSKLRAFGAFWYDFVIGDDWLVAVGIVLGLAGTYGLHRIGVPAWWLLPVLIAVLLPVSLARAVNGPLLPRRRPGQRKPPASPHTPSAN